MRASTRAAHGGAPPPEELIDADLLRIPAGPGAVHVARYGYGGSPVVFLHGFATSSGRSDSP